jgi:hypothetical protein
MVWHIHDRFACWWQQVRIFHVHLRAKDGHRQASPHLHDKVVGTVALLVEDSADEGCAENKGVHRHHHHRGDHGESHTGKKSAHTICLWWLQLCGSASRLRNGGQH